jgi:RNA polymerase sigma-70 factor (ECF subfamily)
VGLDYDDLYRLYAGPVRSLARRKLSGRHISEDVVQEVFLRAFRAEATLDPERPVWPWLRRITLNVCTDVLRSPRTWAEEAVGEVPDTQEADAAVEPAASLLAAEHRQLISDALATLSPRHRHVLLRRSVDGITSEAMAEGEGSTAEAVKSAVKRSRRGFRQAYTDLGHERGLLGAPATPPRVVRTYASRMRHWVEDAARWLGDKAALQSLPALVSAAALLLGYGGGALGGTAQAGADVHTANDVLGAAARNAAASALTSSPSPTARPGGGEQPPSPPPGQDPKPKSATSVRLGSHYSDPQHDEFHITHGVDVAGHYILSGDTKLYPDCTFNAIRQAACIVVDKFPSEVGYWS